MDDVRKYIDSSLCWAPLSEPWEVSEFTYMCLNTYISRTMWLYCWSNSCNNVKNNSHHYFLPFPSCCFSEVRRRHWPASLPAQCCGNSQLTIVHCRPWYIVDRCAMLYNVDHCTLSTMIHCCPLRNVVQCWPLYIVDHDTLLCNVVQCWHWRYYNSQLSNRQHVHEKVKVEGCMVLPKAAHFWHTKECTALTRNYAFANIK